MSTSERISRRHTVAAGGAAPERPVGRRPWLTIHEASDLIGVSEATLRRWAEAGDVEAFVTPGGHRRFARSAILALLPRPGRRHRTLRDLGETPERVVRHYRRELAAASAAGWLPHVDDADKEAFREPGRRMLAAVLGYLDAVTPGEGEADLATACAASAEYGRLSRQRGLGVREATSIFLHLRAPFLEELATIARRRRLEASESISLILAAASVFDQLLLALLEAHSECRPAEARRLR